MLHPQTRALLDLIEQRGLPPTHTLSPAEARASLAERFRVTQPPPPEVGRVQDLKAGAPAGPIPLRLYRPIGAVDTAVLPVLIYYHGGGFVLGDLDTHDTLCRELANLSGCAVVAVDYRLGPEHRFPAAVEDCIAATRWVSAHAAELKLDASRLAVGGDSAGGNLAAVVSIDARETGDLPIAFQLLIYPATDMNRTAPSHTENAQGYFLTRDTMDYFIGHYLAGPGAVRRLACLAAAASGSIPSAAGAGAHRRLRSAARRRRGLRRAPHRGRQPGELCPFPAPDPRLRRHGQGDRRSQQLGRALRGGAAAGAVGSRDPRLNIGK